MLLNLFAIVLQLQYQIVVGDGGILEQKSFGYFV